MNTQLPNRLAYIKKFQRNCVTPSFVRLSTFASDNKNYNKSSDKKCPTFSTSIQATTIPRFTGPSLDKLTKEQKQIYDEIIKTRTTGISGPFQVWLSVPKIANPSQELGKVVRYETSLPKRESELVILLTAAKMKSCTVFDIHANEALLAGVENDVILAIQKILNSSDNASNKLDSSFTSRYIESNVIPLLDNNGREIAIVNFASEMLENYEISDQTYENAKVLLGGKDEVLVEITSIVGYYMYVALVLNVFQIPP